MNKQTEQIVVRMVELQLAQRQRELERAIDSLRSDESVLEDAARRANTGRETVDLLQEMVIQIEEAVEELKR